MLVEMDGFEGNEGVIVIAATNRVDVLDKAFYFVQVVLTVRYGWFYQTSVVVSKS